MVVAGRPARAGIGPVDGRFCVSVGLVDGFVCRTVDRHTEAMPVVSVVMIFLNEEKFLAEAVRSVCDQTLADWELILVDDGSTDRSTSIARDLAALDDRIRYIDHPRHENRGMAASRNFGVAHTTAPYLAFLDADDVWVPAKLAEQVAFLESMPDVAMVHGAQLLWFSWEPTSTKADRIHLTLGVGDRRLDPPEAALKMYPLGSEFGGVDLMVRRNVFETVGGFEERFRGVFEDQSFLIKVFLRYPNYISSQEWIHYRQHDASCLSQTTRTAFIRTENTFLGWLNEDIERLGDARVTAAFQRAHRRNPYKRLIAPALDMRRRLLSPIPDKYKDPVKRVLRRAPS
jgi:glycosyltransferase involved in cell wall biosynthesis